MFNSKSNYSAIYHIHEKLIFVSLQPIIYCKQLFLQSNLHNKSYVPFKNIVRLRDKNSSDHPQKSMERQQQVGGAQIMPHGALPRPITGAIGPSKTMPISPEENTGPG